MIRLYLILFLCGIWACGESFESASAEIRLPGESKAENALPALDSLADQLRISSELSNIMLKRTQDQDLSVLAGTFMTQSQDLYKRITDAAIQHKWGISYKVSDAGRIQLSNYRALPVQTLDDEYLSLLYQHLLKIDRELDKIHNTLPEDLRAEIRSTLQNQGETIKGLL